MIKYLIFVSRFINAQSMNQYEALLFRAEMQRKLRKWDLQSVDIWACSAMVESPVLDLRCLTHTSYDNGRTPILAQPLQDVYAAWRLDEIVAISTADVQLVVAGGFLARVANNDRNFRDADIFVVCPGDKPIAEKFVMTGAIVMKALRMIATWGPYKVVHSERQISIETNLSDHGDTRIYQFVLRVYDNVGALLGDFDLSASQLALTSRGIIGTEIGKWCAENHAMIVDPMMSSPSWWSRISKYANFTRVIFPGMRTGWCPSALEFIHGMSRRAEFDYLGYNECRHSEYGGDHLYHDAGIRNVHVLSRSKPEYLCIYATKIDDVFSGVIPVAEPSVIMQDVDIQPWVWEERGREIVAEMGLKLRQLNWTNIPPVHTRSALYFSQAMFNKISYGDWRLERFLRLIRLREPFSWLPRDIWRLMLVQFLMDDAAYRIEYQRKRLELVIANGHPVTDRLCNVNNWYQRYVPGTLRPAVVGTPMDILVVNQDTLGNI